MEVPEVSSSQDPPDDPEPKNNEKHKHPTHSDEDSKAHKKDRLSTHHEEESPTGTPKVHKRPRTENSHNSKHRDPDSKHHRDPDANGHSPKQTCTHKDDPAGHHKDHSHHRDRDHHEAIKPHHTSSPKVAHRETTEQSKDTPKPHHRDLSASSTPKTHHREALDGTPKVSRRELHHKDDGHKGDRHLGSSNHSDSHKHKDPGSEPNKHEKADTPKTHHREFLAEPSPKVHHREHHSDKHHSHGDKHDLSASKGLKDSHLIEKDGHESKSHSKHLESSKSHYRDRVSGPDHQKDGNTDHKEKDDDPHSPRSGKLSRDPSKNKLQESKETKKEKDEEKHSESKKDKRDQDEERHPDSKNKSKSVVSTSLPDREHGAEVHREMVKAKKGLQDFEKIRLLGRGGVGRVYCVRLKGTDQLYAMKVLTKQEMIANKKVHRVLTEREVLATADHPFVANLYYSFQSKSQLCFIMQYCAGGEFYRWILRQPGHCLTEEQAKFYAVEVLLALEYLHSMGYIYRDLKPENILMHASGHIMLTDFDLSKHALNPVTPRLVTKMYSGVSGVVAEPDLVTNSFVGTEEYLAPEVIDGTGHCATVDWWTLGILIFEMLFGTTPFRGKDRRDTFNNIKKHSLIFPSNATCSKHCKKLVKGLLHSNPKKRLGANGGATDIKDHPFFKDVKWQLVRHQEPPIVPVLTSPVDFQYFGNSTDDGLLDQDEIDPADLSAEDPFKDFKAIDFTDRDDANRREAAMHSAHPPKN